MMGRNYILQRLNIAEDKTASLENLPASSMYDFNYVYDYCEPLSLLIDSSNCLKYRRYIVAFLLCMVCVNFLFMSQICEKSRMPYYGIIAVNFFVLIYTIILKTET